MAPRFEPRSASDAYLRDISYDGTADLGWLRGGLGQLIDGVYGGSDDLGAELVGQASGKLP